MSVLDEGGGIFVVREHSEIPSDVSVAQFVVVVSGDAVQLGMVGPTEQLSWVPTDPLESVTIHVQTMIAKGPEIDPGVYALDRFDLGWIARHRDGYQLLSHARAQATGLARSPSASTLAATLDAGDWLVPGQPGAPPPALWCQFPDCGWPFIGLFDHQRCGNPDPTLVVHEIVP